MSVCVCGRNTNTGQSVCDRCAALALFGLSSDATQAEIKDAYRTLAKVWHPDRFPGDEHLKQKAEEKLKAINAAYQLLTTTRGESRRARPQPPPEEARQAPSSRPRPDRQATSVRFQSSFRIRRRGRRMQQAIVAAILLAGSAWLYLNYGHKLASELEPVTRQAAGSMAHDTVPPKADVTSKPAANDALKPKPATAPRSQPATTDRASLLVYPSDDPGVPYFTVGSTRSDVVKVQGQPTQIVGDVFFYGGSEVYFKDGRVESWKTDPASPLKAQTPQ